MNLKFYLIFFVLVGQFHLIQAQSIERNLLGPSGQVYQDADMNISYTLGEVAIGGVPNGSFWVTQGFQQNDDTAGLSIKKEQIAFVQYKLYPNPAAHKIMLELNTDKPFKATFTVIDISGKQLIHIPEQLIKPQKSTYEIDLHSLSAGNFLLNIYSNQEIQHSLKFVKQ